MVSIIVPLYNAEKFIWETVQSVINQTYKDFELLLVDDCSTDRSLAAAEAINDSRVRVIRQEQNAGAYAARNRGLSEAKGRYIAFLDADDKWEPTKLEDTLKFMEEKDAGFVFTSYEFADEKCVGTGKVVRVPETITYKQALSNTTIFTSTVLIDREKVADELIKMPNIKSEDTATWWQILRAGHTGYGLDKNLVKYRRSAGTLSSNKIEALRRIWNLYRKAAGLSVISSAAHFVVWGFKAVARRI
ncbi:teichuronic acid biosynthesis glycosyltransferase TuaG [Lachnospiraceae bacterium YSD2013]|nr:teichuronic acid biosynthesis glycosyltransferase TuaG [Lachnospiraceae bacterium YSD2013]